MFPLLKIMEWMEWMDFENYGMYGWVWVSCDSLIMSLCMVYLMGHGDIRARKDSWFFKKLVINYFYSFMRRNCRRGIATLSVPRSHLMQVGLYRSMSILEVNLETKWWFSWVVDPMYFSNILRFGRSEGLLGVIWKSCLSIIF